MPANIINVRVMIPLRFPLESIGASLNWIGYTQTVSIAHQGILFAAATQPEAQPTPTPVIYTAPTTEVLLTSQQVEGLPFWTTVPPFEGNGIRTSQVNMPGQPFALSIVASGNGGWSNHNLNGQFRTLTCTLGRIDGGVGEVDVAGITPIISFIGDGRELASFNVERRTVPHEISVDVTGVNILQIRITQPWLVMGGATPVNPALANVLLH